MLKIEKRKIYQSTLMIVVLTIGLLAGGSGIAMVPGAPGLKTSSLSIVDRNPREEVLWDFRSDKAEEQSFGEEDESMVLTYLFGSKWDEPLTITSGFEGSFTRANADQFLYYVAGCEEGSGFKDTSNCSHAASYNAGWIVIYEYEKPVMKIPAALGYAIGKITDVNGDGKSEILSISGYSGMGETSNRGELGQITANGYEAIFSTSENFFFGSLERITFSDDENVKDKCYAISSAVIYTPATGGGSPVFREDYFKSDICDSNWRKITKEQFDADW